VVLMSDIGVSTPPPTATAILSSYPCNCAGRPAADPHAEDRRPSSRFAATNPGWDWQLTDMAQALITGAAVGLAAGAAEAEAAVAGRTTPLELMLANTSVEKPESVSAMRLLRLCK
jgi:hypothetical protein